jgi:hypothetical protein
MLNNMLAHIWKLVIDGWLMSDGAGLEGMIVAVSVNGSCVDAPSTDANGYFSCTRDFSLGGAYNSTSATETATYTITASYDGGQPLSATAYANTLEGTSYAQCTTIQYGHKPSSNSTVLTVTPQSAQATTPTKTPEEMQKEAEQSGWFKVDPEFSWWYPWFRLHYKLDVDLPQGNPKIDSGWSPLPFGQSFSSNDSAVAGIMNDATEGNDPLALLDLFAGTIIQISAYIAAGYVQTPWTIAAAIILYALYSWGRNIQLLVTASSPKQWLLAFIITLASVSAGAIFAGVAKMRGFLTSVARWIVDKIQGNDRDLLATMHGFGLSFFNITTLAFMLIDFSCIVFQIRMFVDSIV